MLALYTAAVRKFSRTSVAGWPCNMGGLSVRHRRLGWRAVRPRLMSAGTARRSMVGVRRGTGRAVLPSTPLVKPSVKPSACCQQQVRCPHHRLMLSMLDYRARPKHAVTPLVFCVLLASVVRQSAQRRRILHSPKILWCRDGFSRHLDGF